MAKYGKCKKCGKRAVHLAMSGDVEFYGDMNDQEGGISEYEDETIDTDQEVRVGAHICFECGAIEDVWIEEPRGELVIPDRAQVDLCNEGREPVISGL